MVPHAQFNFAHQVFRHVDAAHAARLPAIISRNEKASTVNCLARAAAPGGLALHPEGRGPAARDRSWPPTCPTSPRRWSPLAVVSLGGVWSICAPDMGTAAVLDRFRRSGQGADRLRQRHLRRARLRPHRRGGRAACRAAQRAACDRAQNLGVADGAMDLIASDAVFTRAAAQMTSKLRRLSHSGCRLTTRCGSSIPAATGLPKPIVHGHGGTVIVALALKTCTTTWAAATN